MRIWVRRKDQQPGKHYAVHEWLGEDTSCRAIAVQGMNLAHYEIVGKAYNDEHVCSKCQLVIAERRGRL